MEFDKEFQKNYQVVVKTMSGQVDFVVAKDQLDDIVNQWHTIVFDEFPTLLVTSHDGRTYRFNKKKVVWILSREL